MNAFDEDRNPRQTLTYTLINDDGGRFQIVGKQLLKRLPANYEAKKSHTITVRVSDNGTPQQFVRSPLSFPKISHHCRHSFDCEWLKLEVHHDYLSFPNVFMFKMTWFYEFFGWHIFPNIHSFKETFSLVNVKPFFAWQEKYSVIQQPNKEPFKVSKSFSQARAISIVCFSFLLLFLDRQKLHYFCSWCQWSADQRQVLVCQCKCTVSDKLSKSCRKLSSRHSGRNTGSSRPGRITNIGLQHTRTSQHTVQSFEKRNKLRKGQLSHTYQ